MNPATASSPVVAPVGDPGQVGAGTLPDAHAPDATNVGPPASLQSDQAQPAFDPLSPMPRPSWRLPGGYYAPHLLTAEPEYLENAGPWTGLATSGAPIRPHVPAQHEPKKAPKQRKGAGGWLRWLAGMPPRDPQGAFDEQIMPAVGELFVGDGRRPSPAAVANTNAFSVADPRHIWDDPHHDPDDHAGWPLTDDRFEPSPQAIHSTPADPVLVSQQAPLDRPRAGEPNDAGRPPKAARWYTIRPFDQLFAQELNGAHGKLIPPRAATPIRTFEEAPGKAPAPGMDPLSPQPNTFRLPPDVDSIDPVVIVTAASADAQVAAMNSRAAGGWRL